MKFKMKSSIIFNALTTIALASATHGIQSRLPFAASPIGSLSKQTQLFLHVRGGEQDIIAEEGAETLLDTDMVDDGIVAEDGAVVEETPATPMSNNINNVIMSMLLPIKSAMENVGFFYINSLNSYPVQTITLTAVAVVLLISILASVLGSKSEEVEVSTPTRETKIINSAPAPVSMPKINTSIPSGVASRGLITGLGTAAATTFAIFQAVNRPPSEDESGRSNLVTDESEGEEHGGTVFKGV